jgi:hypothetical protein
MGVMVGGQGGQPEGVKALRRFPGDGDRLMIPSLLLAAGVGPMLGRNAEKGSPLCPDEHGVNGNGEREKTRPVWRADFG